MPAFSLGLSTPPVVSGTNGLLMMSSFILTGEIVPPGTNVTGSLQYMNGGGSSGSITTEQCSTRSAAPYVNSYVSGTAATPSWLEMAFNSMSYVGWRADYRRYMTSSQDWSTGSTTDVGLNYTITGSAGDASVFFRQEWGGIDACARRFRRACEPFFMFSDVQNWRSKKTGGGAYEIAFVTSLNDGITWIDGSAWKLGHDTFGSGWQALFGGAAGNLYTQSLTGSLSFTGAYGPTATFKVLAAVLSFVSALNKAIAHGLAATLSFGGNIAKAITHGAFTATLSFVGAMTRGAIHFLTLTATLTDAGALARQTGKSLAATLSFIGAITRRISKGMSAGLSFTGALARQIAKQLAATLSFTGALVRQIGKALSATLSFVGAITRRTAHTLAATLSFVGALTKNTLHSTFTATLSFVGALTTAAVHFYHQALTATLSFAGAIATAGFHHYAQALTATLSFAGGLGKLAQKAVAAVLSFAGALTKRTLRQLAAVLSFVGAFGKTANKLFSASLSFVGSVTKSVSKFVTAALSFIGSVATQWSGGAHHYTQAFAATLAPTAVIIKLMLKSAFAATLTMTGVFGRRAGKGFAATLSFSGALVRRLAKAFTAALSFIGSLIYSGTAFTVIAGWITGSAPKTSSAGSKAKVDSTSSAPKYPITK